MEEINDCKKCESDNTLLCTVSYPIDTTVTPYIWKDKYLVKCLSCRLWGAIVETKEKAIECWNNEEYRVDQEKDVYT